MRLSHLKEIAELAGQHRALVRAERQCEVFYSQHWDCSAGTHCIAVSPDDMGNVFLGMRERIEKRLTALGVTDFEQGPNA